MRFSQILGSGPIIVAQRSTWLFALFLFFHIDILALAREFVGNMLIRHVFSISWQRSVVILIDLPRHFQRLLQIIPNIFEGRPLIRQKMKHLPHQIAQFHLIEPLHLLQIDVNSSGVVPAPTLIVPAPAIVGQIDQQCDFQNAKTKYIHVRFQNIHLVMSIQYFRRVQPVLHDCQRILSDCAGIEQPYLATVDEDFIASQHAVANVEFGQVLECARNGVDHCPDLGGAEVRLRVLSLHYLLIQTHEPIRIDHADDALLLTDQLVVLQRQQILGTQRLVLLQRLHHRLHIELLVQSNILDEIGLSGCPDDPSLVVDGSHAVAAEEVTNFAHLLLHNLKYNCLVVISTSEEELLSRRTHHPHPPHLQVERVIVFPQTQKFGVSIQLEMQLLIGQLRGVVLGVLGAQDEGEQRQFEQFMPAEPEAEDERHEAVEQHEYLPLALHLHDLLHCLLAVLLLVGQNVVYLPHQPQRLRQVIQRDLVRENHGPDVVEQRKEEGAAQQGGPEGVVVRLPGSEDGVEEIVGETDVDEVLAAVVVEAETEQGEHQERDDDQLAVADQRKWLLLPLHLRLHINCSLSTHNQQKERHHLLPNREAVSSGRGSSFCSPPSHPNLVGDSSGRNLPLQVSPFLTAPPLEHLSPAASVSALRSPCLLSVGLAQNNGPFGGGQVVQILLHDAHALLNYSFWRNQSPDACA